MPAAKSPRSIHSVFRASRVFIFSIIRIPPWCAAGTDTVWKKKWFYCVHGAFTLGLVEIDNWESPSRTLQPQLFNLTENDSRIVCVPEGYASCMRAEIPGSVLMVFSGKTLDEAMALSDSYRYDKNYWFNWDDIQ